jgi:osmotically-inducible protein OsmY
MKDQHPANITHLATSLLRAKLSWAVKGITYEYDDGLLVLHGTLASFYHKQLAQEAVRNLEGVRQIRNEIQVHQAVTAG